MACNVFEVFPTEYWWTFSLVEMLTFSLKKKTKCRALTLFFYVNVCTCTELIQNLFEVITISQLDQNQRRFLMPKGEQNGEEYSEFT